MNRMFIGVAATVAAIRGWECRLPTPRLAPMSARVLPISFARSWRLFAAAVLPHPGGGRPAAGWSSRVSAPPGVTPLARHHPLVVAGIMGAPRASPACCATSRVAA
jgi:hypothetical protein